MIFGFDRSPRSQDVRACVCDIMLTSTLEEFLRVLKNLKMRAQGMDLKNGPKENA